MHVYDGGYMILNTAKVKISLLEMPSFSPRNLSTMGQHYWTLAIIVMSAILFL